MSFANLYVFCNTILHVMHRPERKAKTTAMTLLASMEPCSASKMALATTMDTESNTPTFIPVGRPSILFTETSNRSISKGSMSFTICTNDALANMNPLFVNNDPPQCSAPSANFNTVVPRHISRNDSPFRENALTPSTNAVPIDICVVVTNIIARNLTPIPSPRVAASYPISSRNSCSAILLAIFIQNHITAVTNAATPTRRPFGVVSSPRSNASWTPSRTPSTSFTSRGTVSARFLAMLSSHPSLRALVVRVLDSHDE